MTDWIAALRTACQCEAQKTVAARIGYSPAVVNQVLKGTYKGDMGRVQAAVEGALLSTTVECPVIGELPRQRCIEYQRSPYAPTNPMRVALYRTCRICTHRIKRDER